MQKRRLTERYKFMQLSEIQGKRRLPGNTMTHYDVIDDAMISRLKNKTFNTTQNAATQMTKPGVYVSTNTDRVIIPGMTHFNDSSMTNNIEIGEYTLAETIEKRRIKAAIIIQKHYRRYMAQQIVTQLKIDLKKYDSSLL